MRRGKRLLSMLLLCAMLASLCACGKDEKNTKNKATETPVTTTVTPTDKPVTPTDEPTVTDTPTSTPSPVPTVSPWPEEGCDILFPTRDLYHYDMNLQMDPEKRTVGGQVVFSFYNDTESTWDELCLRDYSSLFVDAETAGYNRDETRPNDYKPNGAITEITNVKDSRDDSVLTVNRDKDVSVVWLKLKTPLAPGEKMTLSYDFSAKIPTVPDRYGVYKDVYNVTNFYPILAEYDENGWSHEGFIQCGECFYSEVSDYDVRLTVPEGFLVASTGTETKKESSGDVVTYTFTAPCVRDFVFSASNQFVHKEADYDGVHVNLFYPKLIEADEYWKDSPFGNATDAAVETTLKAAEDSLAAFGEAFGRYPYEELDIIVSRIDAGGMEYPNLIIITDQEWHPVVTMDPSSMEKPSFFTLETCVAHEIGHQWFMGIVGSNSGMEPWLDESITSYTEVVFEEYRSRDADTENTFSSFMRLSRELRDMRDVTQLQNIMQRGMVPFNQSYYEFNTDNDYISAIYQECQRALYQMEEILGRKEFHSIIREYVRRNAFTNSTSAKFFEVLYEYAGKDNEDLNKLIANLFDMERVK